ncbi:MAG: hypothetical protein IJJ72_08570 [Bacteroidales bacterium]|nr:hypothetical protein [Bacteroidales bacterium]
MNRLLILCLSCMAALSAGCGPIEINGGGDPPPEPESYGEPIGTFYLEVRNMTLRLMDITSLYQEVGYISWAVPVNHVPFQSLPGGLKETVKSYGLSSPTQVYRMKWKGETVYHLICAVHDDITGVFRQSGENIRFATFEAYLGFLQEVSEVNCVLIINPELVKSAEGAPNLLEGTWQSDWTHLHHDTEIDDQVDLYSGLPFSLTEVCHFDKDGTGYLRSVKSFKNGRQEVSLDPFTYYLTNYQTDGASYHNYSYICCFAAGDTIEYTARSRSGFSRVFDRSFYFVTYPWYNISSDPYRNKNGDSKYGVPEKDRNSPVVGRWSGISKSAAITFGINNVTWVFRGDGTGYLLYNRQFSHSFVYTVDSNSGSELQLTIYKYDTGFTVDDGFWRNGDLTYSYDASQSKPEGQAMRAKIYDDGDSLELEGWVDRAADMSRSPIVFRRVTR